MNPKHFETHYRITPDDFFPLLEVVEAEGGASLPGPCKATRIEELSKPGDQCYTHGCGEETRMQLPYEDDDGDEQFVTVCVNADLMERWPRLNRELEPA
jgi:hypothetical protein